MNPRTPITLAAAGYSSLADAVEDHDAVWAARRDGPFHHSSLAVVVQRADGTFRFERTSNTASFLSWGDGLLGGALAVLMPRVIHRILPTADLDGRGAITRHFYRHVHLDDLVAAAGLLDDSPVGLVVVVVNRVSDEIRQQLVRAEQIHVVDTVWGDLEEGLGRDLVLQVRVEAPALFLDDYVDDLILKAWRQVSVR